MAPLEAMATQPDYDAPQKDLYEIGEIPPLGHVPERMYAWAIRRERHGEPDTSFQIEVVDTPRVDSNEVLVFVMAAGVNYNGVWAGLGVPISPFDVHKAPYHIAGSDASGIVWAVGDKVRRWKIGDEVVIHCNQDDGDDEHCNGGDPMYSPSHSLYSGLFTVGICPQQLKSLRLITPLAPSDSTKSRLSSSEITPIALPPAELISWIAYDPSPPDAPQTSTFCPGRSSCGACPNSIR
jgi:hypothetical protein